MTPRPAFDLPHGRPSFRLFGRVPWQLWLGIALLGAALSLGWDKAVVEAPAVGAVQEGDKLPAFSLPLLDGTRTDFRDYAGRAVVLNIWATWCAPCRAELPSLARLGDRLDPVRYQVIGISIDEDPDFVREYLRDLGLDLVTLIDRDQSVARGLLGALSLPQTLLVRADGSLDRRIVGLTDWDVPANERLAKALWP